MSDLFGWFRPHEPVHAPHSDEVITKQEHKDECDINNILKQYQLTGIVSHITGQQPVFEDLPDAPDYQQALNTLMDAETAFSALPSMVRDFFQNDPHAFLEAFNRTELHDKLREFGLMRPLQEVVEGREPLPPSSGAKPASRATSVAPNPPAPPSAEA